MLAIFVEKCNIFVLTYMRIIDVNVIRVLLKQESCGSLSLQDYLNDADNGDFNKVCYDTVKSFLGEDDRAEVFFTRCSCTAYELAWRLLVNKEYNKDWGSCKGESSEGELYEVVTSPSCDVECIDDKPLYESKYLRILLPILWHILQKTELVINGFYDKEAEIIRDAVCYQIIKFFITDYANTTFFKNLNEAFGMPRSKFSIQSNEIMRGERWVLEAHLITMSRGYAVYPLVEHDEQDAEGVYEKHDRDEGYFKKSIQEIMPLIETQTSWRAVVDVLMDTPLYTFTIDEKYPHRGGVHKTQIMKYVVKDIADVLGLSDKECENLYNSIKRSHRDYPRIQECFQSILNKNLTT